MLKWKIKTKIDKKKSFEIIMNNNRRRPQFNDKRKIEVPKKIIQGGTSLLLATSRNLI